jgi:hypothetical protein
VNESTQPRPPDGLDGLPGHLTLDYEQTTGLLRALADIHLKLLALVPTVSGTAVALLNRPGSAVQLLALGVLGFTATLGVLLYEWRNSRVADYATRRAQQIEAALGFVSLTGGDRPGGLYSEAPERGSRLFGAVVVDRERGTALVYGAALAGWSYLVAWGVLHACHVGSARTLGAIVGAAVGVAVVAAAQVVVPADR